ncbi:MAG: hypothetical protein ABSB56_03530 [Nitrososphaerales archaeon]|jgi:hypothetical protein
MSYSGLYHMVCMTNAVRATKGNLNVSFFCEKCGREDDPVEVEEARREKARLDSQNVSNPSD